jgi:hypothetical protein
MTVDVKTYKAIIESYGSRGGADAQVQWLERMILDGIKPDKETLEKILPKLFNQYFEKVPVPGKYLLNTYGKEGIKITFLLLRIRKICSRNSSNADQEFYRETGEIRPWP